MGNTALRILVFGLGLVSCAAASVAQQRSAATPRGGEGRAATAREGPATEQGGSSAEEAAIDAWTETLPDGWYARIRTSMGTIVARLLPDQAPQSVAHFAALARGTLEWVDPVSGEVRRGRYYDGIEVHKAEAGRRFEAGSRHTAHEGVPLLFVPREGEGPINFGNTTSALGMTAAPGGRTSGVVFFVTAAKQPFLTPRHPCFGVVVAGEGVAFNIAQVPTYSNGRPIDPVTIERVEIFSRGDVPPLPEPIPYRPSMKKPRLLDPAERLRKPENPE